MPETNPYGEPVVHAQREVRVTDRGHDPRPVIAQTLRILSSWQDVVYDHIADDVELMRPDDPECALCGYLDCAPGCPLMRWRGQA